VTSRRERRKQSKARRKTSRKERRERRDKKIRDYVADFSAKETTIAITVATAFLVLIRLLRVARFDIVTANALVHSAGITSVALGTIVSAFPTVLGLLLYVSLGFLDLRALGTQIAIVVLGLVFLLLSPWPLVVLSIPFFVLVGSLNYARRNSPEGRIGGIALVYVLVLLILLFLRPNMWLPAERLQLAGADPLIGYVVSEDTTWTTVLRDVDRRIQYIEGSEITARRVCRVTTGWLAPRPSLLQLVLGWPEAPSCETLVNST